MENAIATVYVFFATGGQEVENEMPNDCEVWDFFFPQPFNDYFLSKYARLVTVLSQQMKDNLIPRNPI